MPAIVGPIHIDRVIGNGSAHFGDVFAISPKVWIIPLVVQAPIMQETLFNSSTIRTSHLFGIQT